MLKKICVCFLTSILVVTMVSIVVVSYSSSINSRDQVSTLIRNIDGTTENRLSANVSSADTLTRNIYETIENQLSSTNISADADILSTAATETLVLTHLKNRFRAMKKMSENTNFPRMFIIGFAKTGTKALYEALKLHPQLSGPLKEMRYFTEHYNALDLNQGYIKKFPHPPRDGFNIEKSPDYVLSLRAAHRIRQASLSINLNPSSLRFIVMLRNPVVRAVSEFLELKLWAVHNNHHLFTGTFENSVLRGNGEIISNTKIINSSCYSYHIRQWMKVFNKEQFCFVNGDLFLHEPYNEVKMLENCLGLKSFFQPSNFILNKRPGFYCFRSFNQFSKAICMSRSKGRKHPFIEKNTIVKLKQFFAPWNKELYSLINTTSGFNWESSEDF